MAITTYAELGTAVENWLHRADLATIVPDFITLAEADINGRLRVRGTETSTTATATGGTRSISLPTGWLQGRRVYIDTNPIQHLEYMAPQDYWSRYVSTESGLPKAYTIEGENMLLGPIPDSGRVLQLLYYSRPLPLSVDINAMFTANPDLYLYGALVAAEPYLKNDKRMPLWRAQYEAAIQRIEAADSRDRASASVLQIRTDYQVV